MRPAGPRLPEVVAVLHLRDDGEDDVRRRSTVRRRGGGPCEETEHLLEGRLRSQAPEIDGRLLINDTGGRDISFGRVVRVRISEAHDYDLVGGIV